MDGIFNNQWEIQGKKGFNGEIRFGFCFLSFSLMAFKKAQMTNSLQQSSKSFLKKVTFICYSADLDRVQLEADFRLYWHQNKEKPLVNLELQL